MDCSYSEHLPFKWNAKCVQLLEQKLDMGPSSYMSHSAVAPIREPVDPRKAAGFYRDEPKGDSMYHQNRNAMFVSEYNQQPDISQLSAPMAQNLAAQQSYPQQQMSQAVSTYGNIERDFKSVGFGNSNDQITYTSTPGKRGYRLIPNLQFVFNDFRLGFRLNSNSTSTAGSPAGCCIFKTGEPQQRV